MQYVLGTHGRRGPAYMQTIPPAPCHGGGGGGGGVGDLGVAAVGIKATVWKK